MKPLSRWVLASLGTLACCVALHAAQTPPLLLGSSWYPEQWPESRWNADLALMQAAGMHLVRVGEFAWSSLEPQEGHYTLDWLDRAIKAAAAHHIVVVIGTPTDAPPAWLTSKYPETLRVDENGVRMQHGMRRQFSYSSPKYREFCRKIVEQLARRFGHNPDVIGWQIGNEYTEDSYDPESRRLWHEWLKWKYGTLADLNHHWMTAYWSQSYDNWDEIPMGGGRGNPGLLLDYKRFVTDEWRSFQSNQLDVIRRLVDKRQFITTNLGGLGWADRFNRRDIAADLDLASWDTYVGQGHLDPYRIGATHDLVRGWKQKNFWVMEMQPGFVDWAPIANSLDKGETRSMVWQAVGHGADAVAFWQWRAALNGQEQYHGTLVGADGTPVPFYAEARQVGAEFARAGGYLAGTSPESQVAILHDYDSRWAIDFHAQSNRYDQIAVLLGYYQPLRDLTQSVDIVDPRVNLSRYKLVVAPSLNVLPVDVARHLKEYVEKGGHLVLGPRSGMKDEYNALSVERQPGPLVATLGARVEQFYALLDDVPVNGAWGHGRATIWAEYLRPEAKDAQVMLRYGPSNGWLDGQPAVVTRKVGAGTITYIGAVLDPALMREIAQDLVRSAGVDSPTLLVPSGVEVCRRVGHGREVFVVINHSTHNVVFNLPAGTEDVLQPKASGHEQLGRYGVAVLVRHPVQPARETGAANPAPEPHPHQ
ncbi:MAG TPA: beta-galactosidase [Opitutaceae bacterium]|nr:beta-galactosidase [Opitutaceae bacterium]